MSSCCLYAQHLNSRWIYSHIHITVFHNHLSSLDLACNLSLCRYCHCILSYLYVLIVLLRPSISLSGGQRREKSEKRWHQKKEDMTKVGIPSFLCLLTIVLMWTNQSFGIFFGGRQSRMLCVNAPGPILRPPVPGQPPQPLPSLPPGPQVTCVRCDVNRLSYAVCMMFDQIHKVVQILYSWPLGDDVHRTTDSSSQHN